eukprot:CRZ01115.1 hypothetical protein [Spongospora subterranea]
MALTIRSGNMLKMMRDQEQVLMQAIHKCNDHAHHSINESHDIICYLQYQTACLARVLDQNHMLIEDGVMSVRNWAKAVDELFRTYIDMVELVKDYCTYQDRLHQEKVADMESGWNQLLNYEINMAGQHPHMNELLNDKVNELEQCNSNYRDKLEHMEQVLGEHVQLRGSAYEKAHMSSWGNQGRAALQ